MPRQPRISAGRQTGAFWEGGLEQPEIEGPGNGLRAVDDLQLLDDRGHVGLGSPRGDAEQEADVVVGEAFPQESEHLDLAGREQGVAGTMRNLDGPDVAADRLAAGVGQADRGHD